MLSFKALKNKDTTLFILLFYLFSWSASLHAQASSTHSVSIGTGRTFLVNRDALFSPSTYIGQAPSFAIAYAHERQKYQHVLSITYHNAQLERESTSNPVNIRGMQRRFFSTYYLFAGRRKNNARLHFAPGIGFMTVYRDRQQIYESAHNQRFENFKASFAGAFQVGYQLAKHLRLNISISASLFTWSLHPDYSARSGMVQAFSSNKRYFIHHGQYELIASPVSDRIDLRLAFHLSYFKSTHFYRADYLSQSLLLQCDYKLKIVR